MYFVLCLKFALCRTEENRKKKVKAKKSRERHRGSKKAKLDNWTGERWRESRIRKQADGRQTEMGEDTLQSEAGKHMRSQTKLWMR